MWYKVKIVHEDPITEKSTINYYLCDCDNFAEAGYRAMSHLNGDGEIEDVMLMKTLKPLGNIKYADNNKVFIVKIAEDFLCDNGTYKTMKYPIPFYATNNAQLQHILSEYLKQGLENMRVTTISETNWTII